MKNEDIYPPKKVSLLEFTCYLAWISDSEGVHIELVSMDENLGYGVVISHKKSKWDYCVNLRSPKSRLEGTKVILNWINYIFPKEFEDCDWP